MKNIKSHFVFNKRQRNGIFFLAIIIGLLLLIYAFQKKTYSLSAINSPTHSGFHTVSLKEAKKDSLNVYPFNPNYISDYKGYVLGIDTEALDKLFEFRAKGKFINSAEEFQKITGVSDSVLEFIKPYFKFPKFQKNKKTATESKRSYFSKTDLNTTSIDELRKINGIGPKLSERIVKYRKYLKGFSFDNQLYEVYGLKKDVADKVLKRFTVLNLPSIQKIDINNASIKELASLPYLNFQDAKKIITLRSKLNGIKSIKELTRIQDFTEEKIERIALYLTIKNY